MHTLGSVLLGHKDPVPGGLKDITKILGINDNQFSRRPTSLAPLCSVTGTLPLVSPHLTGADAEQWWKLGYTADPQLQDASFIKKNRLTWRGGYLYFDKLLVVPARLRQQVLSQCHDPPQSGHMGVSKTLKRLQRLFWWPEYRADTAVFVKNCLSCARNKPAQHKPYGELSPLPVPEKPWDSVSMDFITDLPLTENKNDAILVVVDRFTKMTHFIPCAISCTAQQAAEMLFINVFRLHGAPSSFVVDRDPRWRSSFFQAWIALLGIKSNMSSAYHPQSDGQTERMNRILEESPASLHQPLSYGMGISSPMGGICYQFCLPRVHQNNSFCAKLRVAAVNPLRVGTACYCC